ncbi:hypothetical protein EZE58_09275 [Brevibacterium sp. LS14]|uniref:hypothetical protein n=1 Tax=Brevibacterium TaxID=1696 RepID=UPI001431D7C4|nr:hypothetical protein [Brevibacterium sp. LS14]
MKEAINFMSFLPDALTTIGGGIIGIVGILLGVKLNERATVKSQRKSVATRYFTLAQKINVQASRHRRRGEELDLPLEPGWDLNLHELLKEMELHYDSRTINAAQDVLDALTDIVETGTVGAMIRFDQSLDTFSKVSGLRTIRPKPPRWFGK